MSVTFPAFFQCKRYTKSVGPREVRDFRGAMAGTGETVLVQCVERSVAKRPYRI